MTDAPLCGLTATAMTALVDAVRAGDIEAAQALLPVDPIVKRAREICGRHFGDPARFLRGECDDGPHMGAVTEALRTIEEDTVLQMARAASYATWGLPDYLSGENDRTPNFIRVREAIQAALVGNPPVVPAMSA